MPELTNALLGVLRDSVVGGSFDLAPGHFGMGPINPCTTAMVVLSALVSEGDAAAVLGGEKGAVVARAALAVLRAAPAAIDDAHGPGELLGGVAVIETPCALLLNLLTRCGAPEAAAAAAPELSPCFSALDATASILAAAAAAGCRVLRAAAASRRRGEPDISTEVLLSPPDSDGKVFLVARPLACLQFLLNAAMAATGAPRAPVAAATARDVLHACAAAVALVPPGVGMHHWSITGATMAYTIMVRAGLPAC